MPETKHYVVTQTRRIRVSAHDELGAARVANEAFKDNKDVVRLTLNTDGVWGHNNSSVSVTELRISKER